jgi:hypothetical protein
MAEFYVQALCLHFWFKFMLCAACVLLPFEWLIFRPKEKIQKQKLWMRVFEHFPTILTFKNSNVQLSFFN